MKISEFKEAFEIAGLDVERSCESNFRNLVEEVHRFNAGGIPIFQFFKDSTFVEVAVFYHKDSKIVKEKSVFQALLTSESRNCWYKNSIEEAHEFDAEILNCFKEVEGGKFVVGYLSPLGCDFGQYDSLEEGLQYLKENYDF